MSDFIPSFITEESLNSKHSKQKNIQKQLCTLLYTLPVRDAFVVLWSPLSALCSLPPPPPFTVGLHTPGLRKLGPWKSSERREKAGCVVETRGRVFGRRGSFSIPMEQKVNDGAIVFGGGGGGGRLGQRRSVTGNHGLCQWTVTKAGRTYGTLSFNHVYIAYMLALCSSHSANNVAVFALAKRLFLQIKKK